MSIENSLKNETGPLRVGSVWDVVGQTPLIRIGSLSRLTGCEIYGKAEFLNPGGSVKDRAAKGLILDAETRGLLLPGQTIVEGTAGNTGIGLTVLGRERGYKVVVFMPDNLVAEKYSLLETLGAEVKVLPSVPFSNPNHFFHAAREYSKSLPGSYWANQFENTANGDYHLKTTGPEIWQQTKGKIDIFTCAVGSSGTMSGVSRYLKSQNLKVRVMLADPMGSGMFKQVTEGKIESEGSSISEGIGIMRITENFKHAQVDGAMRVPDQDMVDMVYHLAQNDGLFVGTSSGLNAMAAYRLGQENAGSKKVIVTILCDSGTRYTSRILNRAWLEEKNLVPRKLVTQLA